EKTMDEAFDQDEEVVWPAPPESRVINRDHEEFSRTQVVKNLLSIPIRVGSETSGVLMLERANDEFSLGEIQTLRLLCDQCGRRLSDLKKHDRWFGARLA